MKARNLKFPVAKSAVSVRLERSGNEAAAHCDGQRVVARQREVGVHELQAAAVFVVGIARQARAERFDDFSRMGQHSSVEVDLGHGRVAADSAARG